MVDELQFEQIKPKLARSVKEHLRSESLDSNGEPPDDLEIHIPHTLIQAIPSVDGQYRATASVTYVLKWPSEKKHTVQIEFGYDQAGRLLKGTLEYV